MIKTTVTLTCDRCGREILPGGDYYVEQTTMFYRLWDGVSEQMIVGEEPEESERHLCPECRDELHNPLPLPADDLDIEPAEEADDSFVYLIPSVEERAAEALGAVETQEPATEPATIAEDVETGETVELGQDEAPEKSEMSEAVELEGKEYTEYVPEQSSEETHAEVTPDAREAAERIVAIAEKKRGKRKILTDAQKEKIVYMMQGGATYNKIAKTVGCSPQTVCNVWHKYVTGQEAKDE